MMAGQAGGVLMGGILMGGILMLIWLAFPPPPPPPHPASPRPLTVLSVGPPPGCNRPGVVDRAPAPVGSGGVLRTQGEGKSVRGHGASQCVRGYGASQCEGLQRTLTTISANVPGQL